MMLCILDGSTEYTINYGRAEYSNLATLALLLAIPASNADSERVFSLVRRVKTDFRASLSTETLSSLISCHLNNTSDKCCKMDVVDNDLIKRQKLVLMKGT